MAASQFRENVFDLCILILTIEFFKYRLGVVGSRKMADDHTTLWTVVMGVAAVHVIALLYWIYR